MKLAIFCPLVINDVDMGGSISSANVTNCIYSPPLQLAYFHGTNSGLLFRFKVARDLVAERWKHPHPTYLSLPLLDIPQKHFENSRVKRPKASKSPSSPFFPFPRQ